MTIPGFWTLALPAGAPAGTYTLFLVVTAAGDPTILLVQATHAFELAP